VSEKRDLKADLEEWHSDLIHGTRKIDWFYLVENYINRAIEADEELRILKERLIISDRWINNEEKAAALTEENDIQRQAIQNLSAQVVAYRDCLEQIGKGICESNIYGIKMYVNELLASPDPGAEIRERLEKLERAAESAQRLCESCLYETLGMDKFRKGQELAKALSSLEGGRE